MKFQNGANLLRLPQNWYRCIPYKILRRLDVRIIKTGPIEPILYAKVEFLENGRTEKIHFALKRQIFNFFQHFFF